MHGDRPNIQWDRVCEAYAFTANASWSGFRPASPNASQTSCTLARARRVGGKLPLGPRASSKMASKEALPVGRGNRKPASTWLCTPQMNNRGLCCGVPNSLSEVGNEAKGYPYRPAHQKPGVVCNVGRGPLSCKTFSGQSRETCRCQPVRSSLLRTAW